ncbi:hypothetical protein DsansV1_C05g0058201 [Dioscorea sansibarensis]
MFAIKVIISFWWSMLIYTQVFKSYAERATQAYHHAHLDPSADACQPIQDEKYTLTYSLLLNRASYRDWVVYHHFAYSVVDQLIRKKRKENIVE